MRLYLLRSKYKEPVTVWQPEAVSDDLETGKISVTYTVDFVTDCIITPMTWVQSQKGTGTKEIKFEEYDRSFILGSKYEKLLHGHIVTTEGGVYDIMKVINVGRTGDVAVLTKSLPKPKEPDLVATGSVDPDATGYYYKYADRNYINIRNGFRLNYDKVSKYGNTNDQYWLNQDPILGSFDPLNGAVGVLEVANA